MNRNQVLDREFLQIRCKLLEVAAALDRIDRAEGRGNEPRLDQIRRAIDALTAEGGRAEAIQLLFSLPYDRNWRTALGVGRAASHKT